MENKLYRLVFLALLLFSFNTSFSQHSSHEEASVAAHEEATGDNDLHKEAAFNPSELINHHLADSHDYKFDIPFFETTLHLPIILWTDNGLTIFSSEAFAEEGEGHGEHGGKIVTKNGQKFVMIHDVIAYADKVDEHAKPQDISMAQRPLDFSITKNVFSMFLTFMVLFIVLLW